nr:CBS domain-containing protein [candidate division Zixibacteria bacterium]
MKVRDILKTKDNRLVSIAPEKTIQEAMSRIVERKIGDLLVMKNDTLIGILSERDILKNLAGHGAAILKEPVEKYMTRKLIIGIPDDDVDSVMAYMTNNRIRHVPILESQKVIGLISIGDIVKFQVQNLKVENRYLVDYITGKYPA